MTLQVIERRYMKTRKPAFTLAEVLITLAIIGIVAALTIPALIENHQQKVLSTAKEVFLRRFQEATKQMNTEGKMTGYNTTEDFVYTFRNYMKHIQICTNGENEKCFAKEIKIPNNNEDEIFQTNNLKTARNFKKDFDSNIVGYVLANGTTMLLTYNPNCKYIDIFDSNADTTQCISMLYDVNGKKKPNRQGEDIFTLGGVQLSVACTQTYEGLDFSLLCEAFIPTALNTCEDSTWDDRAPYQPYCNNNYWAGAKKQCAELGMRLPSRNDLLKIAQQQYVTANGEPIKYSSGTNYGTLINEIMPVNKWYWSSDPCSSAHCAYGLKFFDFGISGQLYNRDIYITNGSGLARCIQ